MARRLGGSVLGLALACALFAGGVADERLKVADALDEAYQASFADLSLTKEGRFGTSRMVNSSIKKHVINRAPKVEQRWEYQVKIYGNGGKPLDPAKLETRYKMWSRVGFAETLPAGLLREDAEAFLRGRKEPVRRVQGDMMFDVRPIRLSNPACLPCHEGMKLGDPVALIVYQVQ